MRVTLLLLSAAVLVLGCGKSAAPRVVTGGPCLADSDCVDGRCEAGVCVSPPPSIGVPACTIGSQSFMDGDTHPTSVCRVCRASPAPGGWMPVEDGTQCGDGQVCQQGGCVAGCLIDGTLVAPGTPNPANPCEVCNPAASPTSYTPQPDGAACGEDQVCVTQVCVSGCFVDGVLRQVGERNPTNACELCDPSRSVNSWTYACHDYYLPYVPNSADGETSASLILQDTRDPAVLPDGSRNEVRVTYLRDDGTELGVETHGLGPGTQYTLTMDASVVTVSAEAMGVSLGRHSTVHTRPGHASVHLRSLFPLSVLTYLSPPGGSARDASAYGAPTSSQVGPTLSVPGLSNTAQRWTTLAVMNVGGQETRLRVRFLDASGAVADTALGEGGGVVLPARGTLRVDLRDGVPGLPADFTGTALVTTEPAMPLVAVVNEWGPAAASASAVGRSTWLGTAVAERRAALPFLSHSPLDGSVTTLTLLNPGTTPVTGSIALQPGEAPLPFGPLAPGVLEDLLGPALAQEFAGTGWLTASGPVVGLVRDEWVAAAPAAGRISTAWTAPTAVDAAATLYLPLFLGENTLSHLSGRLVTSTRIQVANFGVKEEQVQVSFRDPLGRVALNAVEVQVPRNGVAEVPVPSNPMLGTAVVRGTSVDAKLRAVVRVVEHGLLEPDTTQSWWSVSLP